MQTGENFIIVTYIQSAFICSKIQVYDVMVEYNNTHRTQIMQY